MGSVTRAGNNFVVDDIYLFRQVVDPANTDLEQKDIAQFMAQCVQSGIDTSFLKLWFHGHADAPVYWSQKDEATIARFHNRWMLSIVTNHARQYEVRLDIYDPLRMTFRGLAFEVLVEPPTDSLLPELVGQEIKEKVKVVRMKPYGRAIRAMPVPAGGEE